MCLYENMIRQISLVAVKRQPLGIIIIGSILTFLGGLFSLVIVIEIIDSLVRFGFESLQLTSTTSLLGFFIFGVIPVILYSTGMGLFMARPWARMTLIILIPCLALSYGFYAASRIASQETGLYDVTPLGMVLTYSSVFLNVTAKMILVSLPIIIYACQPQVKAYFRKDK